MFIGTPCTADLVQLQTPCTADLVQLQTPCTADLVQLQTLLVYLLLSFHCTLLTLAHFKYRADFESARANCREQLRYKKGTTGE